MVRKFAQGFVVTALAVLMIGCASLPSIPSGPAPIANKVVLDEKAAIAVELAYQAAALSLRTGLQTGIIKGEAAANAAKADRAAYAALIALRAIYEAGNAHEYPAALTKAREAVSALVSIVN